MNSRRPTIGSRWRAEDGVCCTVRSTWQDGVVVRWDGQRRGGVYRKAIFTPIASFYAAFEREVLAYVPGLASPAEQRAGLD